MTSLIHGPRAGSLRLDNLVPRLAAFWCRRFHRQHRDTSALDSIRVKIHCTHCGRDFIRRRVFWQ